jgi:hypothetical protein
VLAVGVLDTVDLRAMSLLWDMLLDPQWGSFWTACQAVLLFLNLFAVGYYVVETVRLRRVAQRQVEAQIRPALEVIVNLGMRQMRFQNLGTGPALDLRVSGIRPGTNVDWDAPDNGSGLGHAFVPAGKDSPGSISSVGFGPERTLQIVYASLSGRLFATLVDFPQAGVSGPTRFFAREV